MTPRELLARLKGSKRNGNGWSALCPAHNDHNPSLSVRDGDNGGLLIHCFAGCSRERVCAALSIDPRELGPDEARGKDSTSRQTKRESAIRQSAGECSRIAVTYDYRDEQNKLLFQLVRSEPKKFRQRRPNGEGGWLWNLNGTRRVPYRLPELLTADPSATVFICEGEKDVDNLVALGLLATTNPGGAGKWRDEYGEALRGRHVCILSDNDVPGREHSEMVANSLSNVAASVRILALRDLPDKGDVSDWLGAGGKAEELRALVASAPPVEATSQARLSRTAGEVDPLALRVACMADVQAEDVSWLWPPYIPIGKLTILEGDPGIGKSWLTCAIASAVSLGRGLPGTQPFDPRNVLILSAEDGLADTLKPRLDAVGADASRVFALDEPLTFDETGLLRLELAIAEHKAGAVTIDPLFAFTGGKVDIHRANECRSITARLAAIAEEHGCAIVAVRHLGKARGNGHALNAGIGSIDITAAARSVLLAGTDPDDATKRAIVQTKNNLAPHGKAVGFTLEDGKFFWTGESDMTAQCILSHVADESERSALNEAIEFLRQSLGNGEHEVSEVKAEAKQAGIAEQTLRRARERLRIKARREGAPGMKQRFFWLLPASDDVQGNTDDVQETKVEHHRASSEGKEGYDNNFPDDVQRAKFDHHREIDFGLDRADEIAERASVLEFDGGLSRSEAERLAMAEVGGQLI